MTQFDQPPSNIQTTEVDRGSLRRSPAEEQLPLRGPAGLGSRTTYTQIHDGSAIPADARQLQPGDLVFTEGTASRPEHVSMAIGDGLVVQAPRPGRVVDVVKVAENGTILAVRRIA
ncbi:NlpC/P60 family protein [Streptomyces sp. RB17]|uniref:NlpC/P60 family protein n=1 Tax=Streptomyces sp. RB17 TaxID=2585197 RepID=UPI001E430D25|nr:NlpC/P60 family protein [Streptomyces sp. RB17]